jgi:Putative zincin peptidase
MALVAVGVALLLELPLESSWSSIFTISVTVFACLIYMAVHEATHGVVLHILTKVKPSYALRFPFLTTGNHAYLTRRSAVVVALAPAVIWGIVLVAALLTLPQDYLLTAYILLALNFAGSVGTASRCTWCHGNSPTRWSRTTGTRSTSSCLKTHDRDQPLQGLVGGCISRRGHVPGTFEVRPGTTATALPKPGDRARVSNHSLLEKVRGVAVKPRERHGRAHAPWRPTRSG